MKQSRLGARKSDRTLFAINFGDSSLIANSMMNKEKIFSQNYLVKTLTYQKLNFQLTNTYMDYKKRNYSNVQQL